MLIKHEDCTNCIHGEVCSRKAEFNKLAEKIQNIDKKNTYEGFIVTAECTYFRPVDCNKDTSSYVVRA